MKKIRMACLLATVFTTQVIAATGTDAQIAAIRKSYGIFVAKVPLDPADPQGD